MKIFLDTADINAVRERWDTGLIAGVTTNPTLVRKQGVPYLDLIKQLAIEFPEFKTKLDLNYSGREVNPSSPAIILHGAADPIVRLRTVNRFVTSACQQGKSVTYRLYTGVDHFQTRQHSLVDTLAWMQDIRDGVTPVSDCAPFVQ